MPRLAEHQGSVAQLVERTTENREVTGSTPVGATVEAPALRRGFFHSSATESHFLAATEAAILFAMPADHLDEAERTEISGTRTASDMTSPPARRRLTGDPERLAAESIERAKNKFHIVVTLVVLAALVVLTISVAVSDVLTAREPSHPGTFTLTYVDRAGREPDTVYGYWVSDDGSVRLPEVILDGAVNASGEAATLYRPTDLLNSVGVPTVRTESRAENRSVLPWIGCAAIAVASFIAFRVVCGMRREKREAAASAPPPEQV